VCCDSVPTPYATYRPHFHIFRMTHNCLASMSSRAERQQEKARSKQRKQEREAKLAFHREATGECEGGEPSAVDTDPRGKGNAEASQ
jgi:hypothetical protein